VIKWMLLVAALSLHAEQRVGWSVAPSGKLDPPGTIEFRVTFGERGTGAIRDVGDLDGFVASATGARFRVESDAGSFDCTGTARDGRGAGTCMFTPDPQFGPKLEQLGVTRPTPEEQLRMAAQGVRLAEVAELRDLGYTALTPDRLIDLRIFRVTPRYIRELAALGHVHVPLDRVIDLHVFRVTIEYIRAQQTHGALSIDELIDRWREQ
jgi:hypothetical protein